MDNTELLEQLRILIEQGQEAFRAELQKGQEALRVEFQEGQEALRRDIIDRVAYAMNIQSETLIERITKEIDKRVTEAETRINIKIENEIDGKLKALFDGYQLNRENYLEMEARSEKLDGRVERLEIRMDVLEKHKTA